MCEELATVKTKIEPLKAENKKLLSENNELH